MVFFPAVPAVAAAPLELLEGLVKRVEMHLTSREEKGRLVQTLHAFCSDLPMFIP